MATPIAMPRQGNTVETCTIVEWHKNKGDFVAKGDVVFSYETDKATFEFESPAEGTLLEVFFGTDEDIPVLSNVGVLGESGESVDEFRAQGEESKPETREAPAQTPAAAPSQSPPQATGQQTAAPAVAAAAGTGTRSISPRARKLAEKKGIDTGGLQGSGPKGRIIERDVLAALENGPVLTSTAATMAGEGAAVPAGGTGIGGRVRATDMGGEAPVQAGAAAVEDAFTEVKLSKMRGIIAERMSASLAQSAQLTMNASADARGLLAYRKLVKSRREALGLNDINITDMVAHAVVRTLVKFPEINAQIEGDTIRQYQHAHLALAVDTPRGLMVPVVRFADTLSLNELSGSLKSLAAQCVEGSINPDLLAGGTLTLSNLGSLGIESFTPIINRPQAAILGLNTITPKPVLGSDGEYVMAPHIGLSLTIDHRAVDGAPGARFLKAVKDAIEGFELTLAL